MIRGHAVAQSMAVSVDDALGAVVFSYASLVKSELATNSCVMAAEGAAILLSELGHDSAIVHRCDVFGWNNNYARVTHGKEPRENRPKPYSLRLSHDQRAEGDGYDGHCVFEFNGWIVDIVSGQFHRPELGLPMGQPLRITTQDFGTLPKGLSKFVKNPEQGELQFTRRVETERPDEFVSQAAVEQNQIAILNIKAQGGNNTGAKWLYALRPDLDDSGYRERVVRDKPFTERLHEFIDCVWRPALLAYVHAIESGLDVRQIQLTVNEVEDEPDVGRDNENE